VPQFVYTERDDPAKPGQKVMEYAADQSGFMVPPPDEQAFVDLLGANVVFLKSAGYFGSVMGPLARIFESPRYLSSLSLGALGNLLEFTIHNAMHMRWSTLPRDPATGTVAARGDFDFDPKWDDPRYDFLGEFYSSHINPLFWRLHGWVDDRIEDWFQAHEAATPGQIERADHNGVSWFKPGPWVQAAEPFDWPTCEMDHHHHDDCDQQAVATMLEVMDIVQKATSRDRSLGLRAGGPGLMSFGRWIEPHV
jgi:hypothetical protein